MYRPQPQPHLLVLFRRGPLLPLHFIPSLTFRLSLTIDSQQDTRYNLRDIFSGGEKGFR
jgi:hypothetical protein